MLSILKNGKIAGEDALLPETIKKNCESFLEELYHMYVMGREFLKNGRRIRW